MTIFIEKVRAFDSYRSIIITMHRPNILERFFLGMQRRRQAYVGHRTQWATYPEFEKVKKSLAKELSATEKRWTTRPAKK